MTKLAVLSEVAEPGFLLMINRVETSFDNKENANKLQEYSPLAMHLINCLMGIIDISQEQSHHMMIMTCVQQKLRQMHDRDDRSTASMVIHLKMTSSEFMADVVRLGLMRGSMQVEIGDLRSAMEAAGRTTRSQVQDQLWSAESARAALTGRDTLGLGGASFGQGFMLKLCTLPNDRHPEESRPQPEEATGTPPVAIPAQPTRAAIIPLLTPPMAIPDLQHRLSTIREPDQASPATCPSNPGQTVTTSRSPAQIEADRYEDGVCQ
jgi:hypothetical protein